MSKKAEVKAIREMVAQVANGTATKETDTLVYRMFGSLGKKEAMGVVIGISFMLSMIETAQKE
jgi:hypothetical protein